MPDAHDQRIILTPGPVTTEPLTRQAMLRDFTPNEPDLLALTAEMRERLVALVHGQDGYVCVPVQGVGNTANEAVLGTLVPRERKLLIVDNGFYGARLQRDRRSDRRALRGARAAVDRAGHGRAARCRARGRCRDQPRDRLPRRHRHRAAQSDRAAGRGGQTARRRPDRGRDRVVRRSADRCRRAWISRRSSHPRTNGSKACRASASWS